MSILHVNITTLSRLFSILGLSLVFQACSGGGGDNSGLLFALLGGGNESGSGGSDQSAPTVNYAALSYSLPQGASIATISPTVTGSPLTGCVAAPTLATGLAIDGADCSISGTPTVVQPATAYTVTATNPYGTGTANFTIAITATGSAPSISYTGSPFSWNKDESITTLTPTLGGNTPTACSASPTLPAGLSINATSCAISGTPTVIQAATTHTITASNAFGSGNTTISVTVVGDTTAPTVTASTPSDTATSVAPDSGTITVTFSESMKTSLTPALTTEAWNGSSYTSIPNTGTTISWTDAQTLQIKISWIHFPENTKIRWTLAPANLQDLAGNAVVAQVQRTFTTTSRNTYFPVADTGSSVCSDATTIIACGDTSFPNQDGDFVNIPNARSFSGPLQHGTYTTDYTTTDNVTGLVWKTCSEGQSIGAGISCQGTGSAAPWGATTMTWYNAINACASMNTANSGAGYAGRKNWRQATTSELDSLLDYGTTSSPRIDSTAFPDTAASTYWTNTTTASIMGSGWGVHFNDASVNYANKLNSGYVRCVSSGP